jgi:hypothetical protein
MFNNVISKPLNPDLYAFSIFTFIIVSAETEYFSTRSWYPRFAEFLQLIYPPELKIKETTDTASSASFLDLYLEFDDSGQLSTKSYDKRDDYEMFNNVISKPLNPDLYAFSIFTFIIVSAETEYFSTRSWYRNINFLREIALVQ